MHAIVVKALGRTTADIRPNLFRSRIAVPCSQHIYAYHHRHHPLYNSMFSAHAPSSEKEQPDTEDYSGDREEDIMVEAFGPAYATRASEEGYGVIYGERVKNFGTKKDPADAGVNPGEASEVGEKENGKHATCPVPPHEE